MSLANVVIGFLGIALGVNSIAKGAQRVSEGMRPQGGARQIPGRVPTVVVPRSATKKMPRLVSPAVQTRTRAGVMGVSKYEVNTLGDRLSVIIDRIEQSTTDPKIIAWARKAVSQRKSGSTAWNGEQWVSAEKDHLAEAVQVFKQLRYSQKYVSDPVGTDTYAKARNTLATGAGDCDEFTTLGAAASRAIGIPARVKVIATKASPDGSADHVYYEILANNKWVPMDASVSMGPGWEAPDSMVRRRWIYEIDER